MARGREREAKTGHWRGRKLILSLPANSTLHLDLKKAIPSFNKCFWETTRCTRPHVGDERCNEKQRQTFLALIKMTTWKGQQSHNDSYKGVFAQVEQRTGDADLEPCAGLWSLSVNNEKPLKIILSRISLFPPQNFTCTKYTKKSEWKQYGIHFEQSLWTFRNNVCTQDKQKT